MNKLKYNPVIVVVGFRRINSLKRLLKSLLNAYYEIDTKLVISLDNDDERNKYIYDYCLGFEWPFGEKEVIFQPERQGLRKHIIKCGDLCYKYGSVIILEEDLYVSPFFYDYAIKALNFYSENKNIAGISLFNYPSARVKRLPFSPINDGSDVFFLQISSSLGQAWTVQQWDDFKRWYDKIPDLHQIKRLPESILEWPDTSWKKYFIGYLVEHSKFFVYPFQSLSTNFNDPGSNELCKENFADQAQLRIVKSDYNFQEFDKSLSVYDVFYELMPDKVKKLNPDLESFDFELDLYGAKNINNIESEYVITKQKCKNFILQFDRALKPHEMNIIYNIKGSVFSLCKCDDLVGAPKKYITEIEDVYYYYKLIYVLPFSYNFFRYRVYRKLKEWLKK